jgi:hypothetical protein
MVMDGITKEGIRNLLRNGIVNVTFAKGDGTIRVMKCTLHEHYLPESKEDTWKQGSDSCAVWDVENSGWRSFRFDSIQHLEVCHD